MKSTSWLLSVALLAGWAAIGQTRVDLARQSQGIPPDFVMTRTSNTVLTIGEGCSLTKPCVARLGGAAFQYTSPATVTLLSGTPTVRVYLSDGSDGSTDGTLKVGSTDSAQVACAGCTVETRTAFPGMSIPLAVWTAAGGQWNGTGTDARALLVSRATPVAGLGITITSGTPDTIAIDGSLIVKKFSGAGLPGSIPGSSRGDLYTDLSNGDSYQCFALSACSGVGSGQWVKLSTGPEAVFQRGPWFFYGRSSSVTGQKPSLGLGASNGTVLLGKIDTQARQMRKIAFEVRTAATSNCGAGTGACGLVIGVLSEDRSSVVCLTEPATGGNGVAEKNLNTVGSKSVGFVSGSRVSSGTCTLPFGNYWWAIGTDSGQLEIAADEGLSMGALLGESVPGDAMIGTVVGALTGSGLSLDFASLAGTLSTASVNLPALMGRY